MRAHFWKLRAVTSPALRDAAAPLSTMRWLPSARVTRLLFATGAAASFVVAFYANPATAFDEGPSLWCIVAIPQHLITYFMALRWRRCAVTKAHF